MDTMEWTKIVGGLCGSLLVFLLLQWGTEIIYHGSEHQKHDEHQSAHTLSEKPEDTKYNEIEEIPFAELVANGDADKGKKVFGKCKSCHKLTDGENGIGPHLFNIIDREIASVSDFDYSNALKEISGKWDQESLGQFLSNPKKYAAGTKMNFSGLKKAKDRANIIKYLDSINK